MKEHSLRRRKSGAMVAFLFSLNLSLLSSEALCFLRGDIDLDDKIGLTESIHALQVAAGLNTSLSTRTINVPAEFSSIQQAIDAASEGDTISVAAGTYTENLLILKNRIKLIGSGQEATVLTGGALDAITIDGAKGFSLQGIKIQGGKYGVYGKTGSGFEIKDMTIQDTLSNGIRVSDNSAAVITNCTVLRSGDDGIRILLSSCALIQGVVVSSSNTGDGLDVGTASSAIFYQASLTFSSNGKRGIGVGGSSSLNSAASGVTLQGNVDDGVGIIGASSLFVVWNSNWTAENSQRRGLAFVGSSWCYIDVDSTLTSRNSESNGMQVVESSNAEIQGTLLLESNKNIGLFINIGSSCHVRESAQVTVKGTHEGSGIGAQVSENSTLRLWKGSLLIENSTGSDGDGIMVLRNSSVAMQGADMSVKIRNNARDGIGIYQESSGRFDPGTEISGNGQHGISQGENSMILARGVSIQNNGAWGVYAQDGGTVNMANSTISGNTGGDLALSFGCRGTLDGNTIGALPISCDGTVLSRGSHVCP